MRRWIALIASLACLLAGAAFAETMDTCWALFKVADTWTEDFDGDETPETLRVNWTLDEYDDGGFLIMVGNQGFSTEFCVGLVPQVYAMRVGYGERYYATLFMINEYGPSDDPLTYCFLYAYERFYDVGRIPALAEDISADKNGLLTAQVRASMIGTWDRPADYMLAWGISDADDDWTISYRLAEVPRAVYPMHMLVSLKCDLSLSSSVYEERGDVVLKAGTTVILAASDDVSRLYIVEADGTNAGWAAMRHFDSEEIWGDCIRVNGRYLSADDVFEGIFYAD